MAGRLEVRAGSMVRQACSESRQGRVKTMMTSKKEIRKSRCTEKNMLVDKTRQSGDRQTQEYPATRGKRVTAGVGWRQSQRQVKQIRA